ncbi:MAG: type II secretion system F family protein [Candidatus Odinarchaeia archaeon]
MVSTLSFYSQLCGFFSKITLFKKIGAHLVNEQLIRSCAYYSSKYKLKPIDICSATVGVFLFFISSTSLIFILLNILVFIPISLLVSVIISFLIYTKLIREFNYESMEISKYADLIAEDFIFALKSSQSIYLALKYVAEGNYPIISNKFREIVYNVNRGIDPKEELITFLKEQPSDSLKNTLLALINTVNLDENYERLLGEESQLFLRGEYEKKTMQLESKLMLISAINIFLPIILGLSLVFYGIGEGPLILFLVPFQILFTFVLKRKLLKQKTELIGG